jgi:hypothetical protein
MLKSEQVSNKLKNFKMLKFWNKWCREQIHQNKFSLIESIDLDIDVFGYQSN